VSVLPTWPPTAPTGSHPCGERAPFDRILATCAVPAIPGAGVRQLAADGRLMADLRAAASSNLIAAHRDEAGNLVGRFHSIPGHFMWLRPNVTDPFRTPGEGTASFDRTAMRRRRPRSRTPRRSRRATVSDAHAGRRARDRTGTPTEAGAGHEVGTRATRLCKRAIRHAAAPPENRCR
jgi:hypothetical protein